MKQHFRDANGSTEILNTICTHYGEGHVVISEVIVQNKDRSKCIWTQELFFSSFVFPWSTEPLFFLLMHPPPLFCFLKHIKPIKCIMPRVNDSHQFTETLGLIVIRCYTYANKNYILNFKPVAQLPYSAFLDNKEVIHIMVI